MKPPMAATDLLEGHVSILRPTHVGRFRGEKVYDRSGRYLGKLKNGKLIKKSSGSSSTAPLFSPRADRMGPVPSVDRVGSVLSVGYEDFPSPDDL